MVDNETHQVAKRLFEEEGMSKAAIARRLNVTPQSIGKWAKVDGWRKQDGDELASDIDPAATTTSGFDDEDNYSTTIPGPSNVTVTEPQTSVAELQTEIIALQAERDELAEENDRLKPTIDIHEWLEDRVAWLSKNTPEGDRYWTNRAELEWSSTTRERVRAGLDPFKIRDEPEMFQKTIDDLKAKAVTRAFAEPTEPASRKIKLAIYRGGKDAYDSEGGYLTIEQIPLEGQINNTAGSLADGIIRYTRKGFKLTDPFLCPRAGHFRPAAVDEFNRWQWYGYCSEKHYNEVEIDQEVDLAGVILKDHGVLSGTV